MQGLSKTFVAPDDIGDPALAVATVELVDWLRRRGVIKDWQVKWLLGAAIGIRAAYEALETLQGKGITPLSRPVPYGSVKDVATYGVTMWMYYKLKKCEREEKNVSPIVVKEIAGKRRMEI